MPPAQTLEEARERLLETFRSEFSRASKARDSANTSRFFKLFPAIGWEKEGLEAYSEFVVDLVRGRASVTGKSKMAKTALCKGHLYVLFLRHSIFTTVLYRYTYLSV